MTITELLKRHGLTQTELSRLTGIPLRTVQHWANGDRQPPDWLIPILDVYLTYTAIKPVSLHPIDDIDDILSDGPDEFQETFDAAIKQCSERRRKK